MPGVETTRIRNKVKKIASSTQASIDLLTKSFDHLKSVLSMLSEKDEDEKSFIQEMKQRHEQSKEKK